MKYSVTVKGTELPVAVSLKKMKQVRLKVFPWGNKTICTDWNTRVLD